MEKWTDVVGYESLYQVSNFGRIKSLDRKDTIGRIRKETVLKGIIDKDGYLRVSLSNGNKVNVFVHRIVLTSFIENSDNKPQVNHINGIKTDNRIENLEWCTNGENQKHRFEILGHTPNKPWLGKFGINNPNSKKINQFDLEGNFIKEWNSIKDIYRELKIHNVQRVCKNNSLQSGGFKWKYKLI